ncbi:hypothetical protein CYD53_11795 [Bosea psychrotolerans]|uniref:PXPV repeat-containing protein n=2 Tax=Bosea psychrotolerans TaxID=1871628 RepID=A0A2S4LZD2_9HYPH|nr:hypothetical protein CYD53_11795 [Bosea psychrotolerans]
MLLLTTSGDTDMASKRTVLIAGVTAAAIAGAGLVTPAFASETRPRVDAQRLDAAPAEYSYYRGYRRGWHGGRGAAVAGAVGLGVLGAAAIAASRPAYADPYYGYDDGYTVYAPRPQVYYEPAPVYEAPVYAPRYRYYQGGYDSGYRSRNGTVDPSRGGR